MECVDSHKDEMLACINSSVPEVFQVSSLIVLPLQPCFTDSTYFLGPDAECGSGLGKIPAKILKFAPVCTVFCSVINS